MKKTFLVLLLLVSTASLAQEGPADHLWELYKNGQFEDVIREGKVELTTGTPTAQVNLAVGRSLADLQRYQESILYLESAVHLDPQQTWVYAWGKVYLGTAHFKEGRMEKARAAWIQARDCGATRNATRSAVNSLKILGLAEFYAQWRDFSSEHFLFRFSPGLTGFDDAGYARRHEEAYEAISAWFGGGPKERITFFVWTDHEESMAANMPPLGFARPELNLIHARANQTVGHEMTHVISSHALTPHMMVGLINEGTSVYHDQTGRDQLARARAAIKASETPEVRVALAALWEDWSLLPDEISYPLGGAWVKVLIDQGGKEKFLEFFPDQSLAHARTIYGEDLQSWMDEFDTELYQ